MTTISAIILTHNEAENIVDCVEACQFADEILIVDDNSTDETISLAQQTSSKVKVLSRSLNKNWAEQRNFAISSASSDWILFVDADERVSSELAQNIARAVESNEAAAYSILRINYFSDGPLRHGVFRPDWVLRLFPKKSGKYERAVHERYVPALNLAKKKIKGELKHYTYRDWQSYWKKFELYTEVSAINYHKNGRQVSFLKDFIVHPTWAFVKAYFISRGFLDGRLGFIFSAYQSLYTLTKYVKLDSLNKHNGKI